jgi:hypothetical protein
MNPKRGKSRSVFFAILMLLIGQASAADNVYFLCVPVKFSRLLVFESQTDIPCQGQGGSSPNDKLCKPFRLEPGELSSNGGFYNLEADSTAYDGTPVHLTVQLSRSTGIFQWKASNDFGELSRTGSCELRKETLKF